MTIEEKAKAYAEELIPYGMPNRKDRIEETIQDYLEGAKEQKAIDLKAINVATKTERTLVADKACAWLMHHLPIHITDVWDSSSPFIDKSTFVDKLRKELE